MNDLTAYRYTANNIDSYNELARFIIKLPVVAKLNNSEMVLEVYPSEEKNIRDVGSFIDDYALDFHLEPIENTDKELIISDLKEKLRSMENSNSTYCAWWEAARKREDRVKMQVEAISALISSIYPKD